MGDEVKSYVVSTSWKGAIENITKQLSIAPILVKSLYVAGERIEQEFKDLGVPDTMASQLSIVKILVAFISPDIKIRALPLNLSTKTKEEN